MSGLDADDLEQRLRPLVRRELLTVEADPRSPERGQYSFVQALIREVAYNTLAHRDRKARHLAAARFFEGLGTDELAGALAGHYLAAHELAPAGPEAEALAGQARLALRGAADRALGLGAHDQAVGFLTQALSVTDGAVDRADLLGRIGESETISGHHELAEHHLRDAVAGWRATGERERVALATASLVSALLNAYQPDVALEVIAAAADEFADLAGSEGYTAILGQLARTHFLRGDMRAAVAVSDRVLEAAEHANMIGLVADTLVTKGTALVSIGRVREGFALLNGGLETAQRHRVTAVATRAFINSSFTGLVHDPREALAVGRTGLDFAGRIGRRSDAIFILGNAAVAALRVGEWDWIATEVPEALGHDMAAGDRVVLLEAMIALGALRGDPVDPALAEIEAVSGAATDIQQQAAAHSSRGYVALAGGRFDVAVAAWRTAGDLNVGGVAIMLGLAGHAALLGRDLDAARSARAALEATGIHGPAPDADRLALDAGIAALAGRPDEALGFYRQAARAYQDLGLQWDEALAGLEAAVLLDPGSEAVRTIADRTRATLQRLRAVPMLAQLDAALDRDAAGPSDADSRPVEVEAR